MLKCLCVCLGEFTGSHCLLACSPVDLRLTLDCSGRVFILLRSFDGVSSSMAGPLMVYPLPRQAGD